MGGSPVDILSLCRLVALFLLRHAFDATPKDGAGFLCATRRGSLRATGGTNGFPRGVHFLLPNQNLLYMVLKYSLNTKHSGSERLVQAVFDTQKRGWKTTGKTAVCGACAPLFTIPPPAFHRLFHRFRDLIQPTNGSRALRICDKRARPTAKINARSAARTRDCRQWR